jgi:hypothetical protein
MYSFRATAYQLMHCGYQRDAGRVAAQVEEDDKQPSLEAQERAALLAAKLATLEDQAVEAAEEEAERRRAVVAAGPCPELLRMQAERYLQLANGLNIALVNDYVPPVYDADQRRRAVALSEQNAAPRQALLQGVGGEGNAEEKDGEEDRLGAEEGVGEAAMVPVDTLSDVDDEEIASYLATEEEAAIRKQMWTACNECVSDLLGGFRLLLPDAFSC